MHGRLRPLHTLLNLKNCYGFFENFDLEKRCAHLLRIWAETKAISEGQALHAHITKILPRPQIFLSNSLLNMYFKCGLIADAQHIFDEILQPDVVSWNTMIRGCLLCGYGSNSILYFRMMLSCGVVPDQCSFTSVLKGCVDYGDFGGGSQIHGLSIKFNLGDNVFVANGLVELYARFYSFNESVKVFDSLVFKDIALINTVIGVFAKTGNLEEAFVNFRLILSASMRPTRSTFVNLLSVVDGYESLRQQLQVHGLVIKVGFENHGVVENSLVGMYACSGCLDESYDLLVYLNSKNVRSWTTLIAGYNSHGCFEEAMNVFCWIYHDSMVVMDEVLLACILSVSATSECLHLGTQIHCFILKTGIEPDTRVRVALMDMYAKCSCMGDTLKIFRQIGDSCDLLSWTTVISGNVQNGFPVEGLRNFSQMHKYGVKPDTVACVSVLTGCIDLQAIEQGELIHAYVTKSGCANDISVQTALVSLYVDCGCFDSAMKLFEKMIKHDVVSWTALISGYAKLGYSEEALVWLIKMLKEGVMPNHFTLTSALTACAQSTAIEIGKSLHTLIIKLGTEDDKFNGSALIDMYSKCGTMEDAVNYFYAMPKHDIVVWNALLAGHAHHGNGIEVLKCFVEMKYHGMKPDSVTFLSVLSGCSHGGLVNRVVEYFVLMRDNYGISPMMEHYACVVDALGRAGLFKEVVEFVDGMRFEPGIVVLRSLLSCCILHGCTRLGFAVVARMVELGEDDASTYVLLSKLYAIDERWEDARMAREVMERKLWRPKEVGKSWIESKNFSC